MFFYGSPKSVIKSARTDFRLALFLFPNCKTFFDFTSFMTGSLILSFQNLPDFSFNPDWFFPRKFRGYVNVTILNSEIDKLQNRSFAYRIIPQQGSCADVVGKLHHKKTFIGCGSASVHNQKNGRQFRNVNCKSRSKCQKLTVCNNIRKITRCRDG